MTMAKKAAKIVYNCEECKHSYDLHEKGANGKPFLCRCKVNPVRSRFLKRDGCIQFAKSLLTIWQREKT